MVVKIKKAKGTKKCVIRRKLKFDNYKNLLEATKLKNKIKYPEKNKINIDSNDDKRMHSIASIEKYAYGTSKDLVCEKEEIKCSNIKKQYKND